MAEMMLYSLPSDIKTEIFSQLPVDSILQCKRVCKTWQTLINDLLNDPSFVNIHVRQFLSSSQSPPAAAAAAADAASSFSFLAREKSSNDKKDWCIVGSCNGLICLVRKRYDYLRLNMCICNPVTKEYVNVIPQFDLSRPYDSNQFHLPVIDVVVGIGFGYVLSTKEYKCVRITCDKVRNMYVSVYTLGSSTWRMKKVDKEDPCYDHLRYCDNENEPAPAVGSFLNGALYWRRNLMHYIKIILFDLEKEEFRSIQSPLQSSLYTDKIIGVFGLGGCFCLIRTVYYHDASKYILVVNKEEEDGDYTWTTKFMIEPAIDKNITPPFALEPKIFSNYDYMNISSYDPRTRSHLDHYLIDNNNMNFPMVDSWLEMEMLLPYVSKFEMIPYMKSLVSLKALGENDADVVTAKRKRIDIYDPLVMLEIRRKIYRL